MSRFLFLTSITVCLFTATQAIQAQEVKMGLVDFARAQRQWYKTDTSRKIFEEKRAGMRGKVEEQGAALKELLKQQQDAQKELGDATLSQEKKQAILKAAQERGGKINNLQRQITDQGSKANAELAEDANAIQKKLTTEIFEVIAKISTAKDLDIVFNRTFGINGVPTVAYSSEKVLQDFTEELVAELNKTAPAGWKPPTSETASN